MKDAFKPGAFKAVAFKPGAFAGVGSGVTPPPGPTKPGSSWVEPARGNAWAEAGRQNTWVAQP